MIEHVLNAIKLYLAGKYPEKEDYPFYLELENELLFDNYDEMYKENKEVTEFLNEEIPDLCAAVGEISIDDFKRRLKEEYTIAVKLYNQ
jgi:hypothetical protein